MRGLAVTVRWLPKAGNDDRDYEDAFSVLTLGDRARIAVADGASEAFEARRWARLLVDGWVRHGGEPSTDNLAAVAREAGSTWAAKFRGLDLPYNVQPHVERGSAATFLAAELSLEDAPEKARWRALAIGDSCLFMLRAGRLLQTFPLESAAQFGLSPDLLASRRVNSDRALDAMPRAEGQILAGDSLFLTTDAVGAWLLGMHEAGEEPWESLSRACCSDGVFEEFIEHCRTTSPVRMRNDDVTVVRLHLG